MSTRPAPPEHADEIRRWTSANLLARAAYYLHRALLDGLCGTCRYHQRMTRKPECSTCRKARWAEAVAA